jgi:hypothetical protein
MNQLAYFEIQADEPQRAVKFYGDLFGWKFTEEKNLPIEYWRIQTESMGGGILKRPVAVPTRSGTNAYVCSFEVENFDAMSEKIVQSGGIVAMAKFAVPGKCWQGYFLDTEANTFGIFQVDEKAS